MVENVGGFRVTWFYRSSCDGIVYSVIFYFREEEVCNRLENDLFSYVVYLWF